MHHRCLLTMMATASLLWRTATASWQRPFHSRRAIAFLSNKCNARNSNAIQRSHIPLATAFSENRYMTTTTAISSTAFSSIEDVTKKPIPIILLAGFLGAGKTSTLKHLLENNVNVRIGTIVNDVASVNIDAKLVSNVIGNINNNNSNNNIGDGSGNSAEADPNNYYANGGGMIVELQNGCACCSLADELLTSVSKLTESGQRNLDAIIVELSGVADPMSVRDNWEQARLQGHPATRVASLERTVTLIDACTFGTDWMSWDAASDRSEWDEDGGQHDGGTSRKVPELLAEQVEAADLLLVNKVDMADPKEVVVATEVARGLLRDRSKGNVMEVSFGRINVADLLGKKIMENIHGVTTGAIKEGEHDNDEHSHSHGHDNHEEKELTSVAASCDEPECSDTSHSHSHDHASSADKEEAHSNHKHTSSSSTLEECNDPVCTDPTHDHSHSSHSHSSSQHATSTEIAANHLGITSFVYRASVPFNSQRLLALLNQWPVPMKDTLDFGLVVGLGNKEGTLDTDTPEDNRAFVGVLRSKGFCWMAPTCWSNDVIKGGSGQEDGWRHDTAMYWSHAGKHFGISTAGKWWASLGKDGMKPYFANNMVEYDRIMKEDWCSEEWGDRRQELVFIGTKLDESVIRTALDQCLCTEAEMVDYRSRLTKYIGANQVR